MTEALRLDNEKGQLQIGGTSFRNMIEYFESQFNRAEQVESEQHIIFDRLHVLINLFDYSVETVPSTYPFGSDIQKTVCFLSHACEHGCKTIVKLLLEAGANLYSRDIGDQTPFIYACKGGHCEIIDLLVQYGADDMTFKNKNNCNGFLFACQQKHWNAVRLLLDNHLTRVDLIDTQSKSALHYVCEFGEREALALITTLFDYDIAGRQPIRDYINVRDLSKNRCLKYLDKVPSTDVIPLVNLLLDNGANDFVEHPDLRYKTVFMFACQGFYGDASLPVAHTLVDRKVISLNAKDEMKKTTLMYACRTGDPELVKKLLVLSEEIRNSFVPDDDPTSALRYNPPYDLHINDVDNDGFTAIHHAIESTSKLENDGFCQSTAKIVQMLLDFYSTSINLNSKVVNKSCLTLKRKVMRQSIFQFACEHHAVEIAAVLLNCVSRSIPLSTPLSLVGSDYQYIWHLLLTQCDYQYHSLFTISNDVDLLPRLPKHDRHFSRWVSIARLIDQYHSMLAVAIELTITTTVTNALVMIKADLTKAEEQYERNIAIQNSQLYFSSVKVNIPADILIYEWTHIHMESTAAAQDNEMNVDYTESTIMMIRKQLHRLIHNSVQQFQAAEKAIQKAEERKRKREQASVWFVQDDDLLQSADHQSVLVVIKSALKNETELILRERFLLSDLIASVHKRLKETDSDLADILPTGLYCLSYTRPNGQKIAFNGQCSLSIIDIIGGPKGAISIVLEECPDELMNLMMYEGFVEMNEGSNHLVGTLQFPVAPAIASAVIPMELKDEDLMIQAPLPALDNEEDYVYSDQDDDGYFDNDEDYAEDEE